MKLINGSDFDLALDGASPNVKEHFRDPFNYTNEIIAQFDANYYKDIIQPGNTLLDIGANIGLFTLHVAPYFERIVCVEPTPSHFEKLRELTAGLPDVRYEQAALHNYTGETTFYWCGINTTMNSLQNRSDRQMQVPCITLADLIAKYELKEVDLCKIDIEGSEDVAITVETLRPVVDRIKKIFIELHPPNRESQDKFQQVFEEAGYNVERYVLDSLICTQR